MRRHRTRVLAAIVSVAAVSALVVAAALVVRPTRATPSTGVTTAILAKSVFDPIHVNSHARTADHWRAQLKTTGTQTSTSSTTNSRPEGPPAGTPTRVPA
jgi:hypothetical protein